MEEKKIIRISTEIMNWLVIGLVLLGMAMTLYKGAGVY